MTTHDGYDRDPTEGRNDSVKELNALLANLERDSLDEESRDRLCTLLSESEGARWAYVHAVHLREGIKRWARTQGEADIWAIVDVLRQSENPEDQELAAELENQAIDDALLTRESLADQQVGAARRQVKAARDKKPVNNPLSSGGNRWQKTALAIAASLLVLAVLWQRGSLQDAAQQSDSPINDGKSLAAGNEPANTIVYALSDSDNVVARVTSTTNDVQWARDREPQDFLMRFRPGEVVGIERGLIQIEFSAGALLVVEAPAALRVTSATSARLIEGRVVGKADNGNFSLLTPTASVVDIGTEFGVGVTQGSTEVTVFKGEVHVLPLSGNADSKSMQKLLRGMSTRIDSQGLSDSRAQPNPKLFHRNFVRLTNRSQHQKSVSLLDLISGHDTTQQSIAGSIDPHTGYWGRPPWLDPQGTKAQRGDTQFAQTDWNPMVDGVFIPRSNAREMQIDSDGHMVYLPPNSGSTWGPIWARRHFDASSDEALLSTTQQGYWAVGASSQILQRLRKTRDGLMGLHANVGITFDLDAVRRSSAQDVSYFKAVVANMDSSPSEDSSDDASVADLRVFVDGKLRYSRLQFGHSDGEATVHVSLSNVDRFLTIVTTDAGVDPVFDHVVLVDPVIEYAPPPAPEPDRA